MLKNKYIILIYILFSFINNIYSFPILEIKNSLDNNYIGEYFQVYEDNSGKLSINELKTIEKQNKFQKSKFKIPNYGYTSSTFWHKLVLKREVQLNDNLYFDIQNSNIDEIEIYEIYLNDSGSEETKITKMGDSYPFLDRKIYSREFIFFPAINKVKEEAIYIKIKSTSSLIFPVVIFDQEGLNKYALTRELFHGVYYGVVISMLVYNLFVFISTKDITFFYYIFYILGFGFLQGIENGHTFIYFWDESIEWQKRSFSFFMGIVIIFGSLFSKSFLKTSIYSPILNKYLLVLSYLGMILVSLSFIMEDYKVNILAILLAIICLFSIFFSAILIFKKNFEPTKYFLLAWIFFLFGSTLTLLRYLGLFDLPIIGLYSLEIASIFQIIVLSYALTAKTNIIKRENQEAIKRTVLFQEKANAELESKVKERTIELNKYLLSLEKDLKMARNIQTNILPKNIDKFTNFNISAFYSPLEEVGGDFFDIYQMNPNKIRVLIADATGHGIQAAMVTMTIKSEYDSLKVFLSDPGELMDELHKRFMEIYKNMKIYFTAFVADIDLEIEELNYASAGHPTQYLIHKSQIIELSRTGYIIGMLNGKLCSTRKIKYSKSDKLLLFTDGLYEEFNDKNEQFGDEKLKKIIEENISRDIIQIKDKCFEKLYEFLGNQKKQDDITFIGIQKKSED